VENGQELLAALPNLSSRPETASQANAHDVFLPNCTPAGRWNWQLSPALWSEVGQAGCPVAAPGGRDVAAPRQGHDPRTRRAAGPPAAGL